MKEFHDGDRRWKDAGLGASQGEDHQHKRVYGRQPEFDFIEVLRERDDDKPSWGYKRSCSDRQYV